MSSQARLSDHASVVATKRRALRTRIASQVSYALWLVVVLSAAALFLIPFAWMLSSSLKLEAQIFTIPPQWIPWPIQFENYLTAWTIQPTAIFFRNTLVVVVLAVVGDVFSSSLAAFGFARLRFRGRDLLFILLLSTIMLPMHVTLIPQYLLFARIGWVDTFAPLIVPSWFGVALHVFLLRQFLMTISHDIDDAAKIDGANYWDIYYRIAMPLAAPALGVVAMFSITQHWTEFTHPLIYLNSKDLFTLSMGLRAFQTEVGIQHMHILMAVSTMAVLPLVLIFLFGQRYFVRGVALTGMH